MRERESTRLAIRRHAARGARLASAVLLASLLTACGGSGDGGVTGGSAARRVVAFAEWQLDALGVTALDVTLSGSGSGATLDALADWTHPSNDVSIYLTTLACTEEAFAAAQCSLLGSADGAKPERLTYNLSAGGSFRFWIVNFGPERESGTIEVGLTQ